MNKDPVTRDEIDGFDLYYILDNGLSLDRVLRRKVRYAAETSCSFVSVRDLFPNG